jgi:hypothetical protein
MRSATPMLGAALSFSLLVAPAPAAEVPAAVAGKLNRATELLLGEHPTESQLRQGFLHLLDAVPLVIPQGTKAPEWLPKLAEARALVEKGSPVEPRAVALLNECYRATHGGQGFRMPPSVDSIADAREQIRLWMASVPGLVTAGDGDEAARRLLEASAAIVTPMER